MESIFVFTFAIVLLLILIQFRLKLPEIKGSLGEKRVARVLNRLNNDEYLVFHDLYLKSKNNSTQIDHLIVSIYGVFVIESKNYRGWIHGNEKSEYWYQTFYQSKFKLINPVKQNRSHILFLKKILKTYDQSIYNSIVVFSGTATLKNVYSETPVIYLSDLKRTLRSFRNIVLTKNQIEDIVQSIGAVRLQGKNARKEHKDYVNQIIRTKKFYNQNHICPKCQGHLKKKEGSYGKFLGCSNFPKCNYTTNIKSKE